MFEGVAADRPEVAASWSGCRRHGEAGRGRRAHLNGQAGVEEGRRRGAASPARRDDGSPGRHRHSRRTLRCGKLVDATLSGRCPGDGPLAGHGQPTPPRARAPSGKRGSPDERPGVQRVGGLRLRRRVALTADIAPWGPSSACLYRLLPLKQPVLHPFDPRTEHLMRRPRSGFQDRPMPPATSSDNARMPSDAVKKRA